MGLQLHDPETPPEHACEGTDTTRPCGSLWLVPKLPSGRREGPWKANAAFTHQTGYSSFLVERSQSTLTPQQ